MANHHTPVSKRPAAIPEERMRRLRWQDGRAPNYRRIGRPPVQPKPAPHQLSKCVQLEDSDACAGCGRLGIVCYATRIDRQDARATSSDDEDGEDGRDGEDGEDGQEAGNGMAFEDGSDHTPAGAASGVAQSEVVERHGSEELAPGGSRTQEPNKIRQCAACFPCRYKRQKCSFSSARTTGFTEMTRIAMELHDLACDEREDSVGEEDEGDMGDEVRDETAEGRAGDDESEVDQERRKGTQYVRAHIATLLENILA